MNFGSDNQTGASKPVLEAILAANDGTQAAYSDDDWTAKAKEAIRQTFDCDAEVFFVSTGTAANTLSLSSAVKPWDSILCHGQAHIINDELTAPEFMTGGARLIGLDTQQAKLSYASVASTLALGAAHPPHNAVPKVLSLTQINESGQVYQPDELTELCALAHDHGLVVHMDGARFANAVAALDCHPADISWRAGVDMLCLGATKNGALAAEAVVFFNKELAEDFVALRKRSGHLLSKGRYLGAQFFGWLENNHWLELAHHANRQAQKLNEALTAHPDFDVLWPVQANELFVELSKQKIAALREAGAVFYEWPRNFIPADRTIADDRDVVRLVTAFTTQDEEVEAFIAALNS